MPRNLQTMGHSALDTREQAALVIASAVGRGELDGLADRAPTLDALLARPALRLRIMAIGVAAAAEAALPAWKQPDRGQLDSYNRFRARRPNVMHVRRSTWR